MVLLYSRTLGILAGNHYQITAGIVTGNIYFRLWQWFSTCGPWPTGGPQKYFAVGTEQFGLKKLYLHDELFIS